ncbi:hypothetical protein Trydic_g23637 [Trypoxylus dichotomus]
METATTLIENTKNKKPKKEKQMGQQLEQANEKRWQKVPPTSTKVRLIAQLPQVGDIGTKHQPENHKKGKSKMTSVIPLESFLNQSQSCNIVRNKEQHVKEIYKGNMLDASLPTRSVGKHREVPKKKVQSRLKQDILKQKSTQVPIETLNYCDNLVNEKLNEAVAVFLKRIVTFQEHAFKKDPDKARIKKRYIVGFHETRKYVLTRKVKLLIIAADMRVNDSEELLYKNITEMKDLAIKNDVPYVFALKRSKLGNLTMKYRPISCVGALNYQGAEDEFHIIFDSLTKINNDEKPIDKSEEVYGEFLDRLKGAILQCDDK